MDQQESSEQQTQPMMQLNSAEMATIAEDFTEPAPPEQAPEKITRKQIGQLRRQYITVVNGVVKACGHKDNFTRNERREGKIPSNNCVYCWEAYFLTSVDLDLVHTVLSTRGVPALVAMKGKKFTKMFHGFLSSKLVPMLNAEASTESEAAPIVGGTFGNESTEVQTTGNVE
jgi:hypothetical protein